MNFTQQFVAMTMAALRADGMMESVEMDAIKRMAADLELNPAEVDKAILDEIKNNSDFDEVARSVTDYNEACLIMEACIQVVLADDVLEEKEVSLLLRLSQALNLPTERMVLALAAIAQNDRNIRIKGNDSDFEADEIIEIE